MTTNDIAKIRKPQTRLKRTQICPQIAQKRRGQPYVNLQLILAFISSKYVFPYKVYKSYTELGLPVGHKALTPKMKKKIGGHRLCFGENGSGKMP